MNQKLGPHVVVVSTFSRGFDEQFVRTAHKTGRRIMTVTNIQQNISEQDIGTYGIEPLSLSYNERDTQMIQCAKTMNPLLLAFVRTDYKEHSSGRGTLTTIAIFKNASKKKYDLMYIPNFDNNVYLITTDPDTIHQCIDELVNTHYNQIMQLFDLNGYDCIATSGPVDYPPVAQFAKALAERLF